MLICQVFVNCNACQPGTQASMHQALLTVPPANLGASEQLLHPLVGACCDRL